MIKLETNYENEARNVTFYFRTQDDCDKFIYVFKDHWCHVRWKDPVIISDREIINLSDYDRKSLDEDPKERAESDLSWGFNLARYYNDNVLTSDEQSFINNLIKDI